MKKIVVLGDSHSQLFANDESLGRGTWEDDISNYFDVRWLGPKTYWRLCRDKTEFINLREDLYYQPNPSYNISTKCNLEDDIIISLGEIDVRCNILKVNNNFKKVIDNMIDEISKYIDININYNIHLLSIPPPIEQNKCKSINYEFPFIGSDESRRDMTYYFNYKLSELSKIKDIGFLDIHSFYSENGFLKIEKSDNIVHCVKTSEFENYIKKYFNL